MNLPTKFKYVGIVLTIAAIFASGVTCGRKLRGREIADLSTKLASSEKTVEVQKNLYATKTHELDDIAGKLKDAEIFSKHDREMIKTLLDEIEKAHAKILTLDSLVIKWKKAYEGALAANQGQEPPSTPGGVERKRVDFNGALGFMNVRGHTLTDPAEAFLHIEQARPLVLQVAVTKNRDGTWSTYVESSEDDVGVDVKLSGIDLSVVRPTFRQRLWIDSGVYFLGGAMATIGVSYRGNRWSLGASCGAGDARTCGLTFGLRPFE